MHRITVQYDAPADPDAFEARYRDEHLPLVHRLPGLERCTLCHPHGLGGPAPYLVAEMWFADGDAMRAALRSPEMAAAGEHAAGLGARMVMFTGEVTDA